MQIKSFIDIAPAKEKKVCGNCISFRLHGVVSGSCTRSKTLKYRMNTEKCPKFCVKTLNDSLRFL